MVIEGLVDSEIMQLMPVDAVRSMINILMGSTAEESSIEALVEPTLPEPPRPAYQLEPTYSYPPPTMAPPPPPAAPQPAAPDWGYQNYMAPPSGVKKGEQFAVQPVQFVPLQETYDAHMPQNIGLIMDVPLDVTVELGKARKTIKEVLELTQGSIIQLDKMAGEPVDLMVNGKLIAKGEVVVIDENYGIRITTILSPIDRMNKLQ
jgi:flagellar motor switch protein FliN/FliY